MSVRYLLFALNILVLIGLAIYVIWAVLSPKRAQAEGERTPANRAEFLPDEDLESRRLERVLGWALLFGGILAVALPLYWLREPTRQEHSETYFEEGSIERGATYFAQPGGEHYDSVLSLQCAKCHGDDAGGGVSSKIIDRDGADGPEHPQQYFWKEPALNTVLLRFSPEEVAQIITYGRPGTPMPAFGVPGGGAENEQTIGDLIAYLESIQLTPDEAKKLADDQLAAAKTQADDQVEAAQESLASAEAAADEASAALEEALSLPGDADEGALTSACDDITAAVEDDPGSVTVDERKACKDYTDAITDRDAARRNLAWAETWQAAREDVSDGQLLFELFCARCHTEGWSAFDPADPNSLNILGLPGGGGGQGGGIGYNLRDGAEERRFGTGDFGATEQAEFVTTGSEANLPYGYLGIGSGRMPGFGSMLSQDQINQIVEYEREGLDDTVFPSEDD